LDYPNDEEVARLIARSDALLERSRDVNEWSARVSSTLRRVLTQCNEVCNESDGLYGRPKSEKEPEK
jgi:hypothetical protein